MLVATGWLGEGSTAMPHAERVKDAAEAYRSGDLLVYVLEEVATSVEGAMHDGCCRPVGGRRRRPPASARSGHCIDRRPTSNGGRP
jgi:hypothetical protein